jgi:enoyl-CoA hydratase/carnithine racemase
MGERAVEVSVAGGRADLLLRRPEVLNAMNWDVFDGLAAAADELAGHEDVRVVVIAGEGKSFSSGIDVTMFSDGVAGGPGEMIRRAQAGFRKLAALEMPVIAAVRGHALGAGLQLALVCDLRVVASDATLGILEQRFSLVPDLGGTQRLPALVGPGYAKQMVWLQERIDGGEAHRRGLAEIVCDLGELDAAVDYLAERLCESPPLAVRAVKRLMDGAGRVPFEQGMDEEAAAQAVMFGSADFGEAMSAFFEKRRPRYQGR